MLAISDEFVEDRSDKGERFRVVQSYSTCKTPLSEETSLRYQKFVDL